jgi:hypothetical protein
MVDIEKIKSWQSGKAAIADLEDKQNNDSSNFIKSKTPPEVDEDADESESI